MNELEKNVFRKSIEFILSEVSVLFSNANSNDLNEEVLKLTKEEREVALKFLNVNCQDDITENLNYDFHIPIIIKNMMKEYFKEECSTNDT